MGNNADNKINDDTSATIVDIKDYIKDDERKDEEPIVYEVEEESEDVEGAEKIKETVVDDTEDATEGLKKAIDKSEKPKEKKSGGLPRKILRVAGIVVITFIALVLIFFLYAVMRPAPDDDKAFSVDDPNDPNSYTNTAIASDQSILPLVAYTITGKYTGIEEKDVYSEYSFIFDETGYYEGYSSVSDDDFGKWEIISNGDDFVLEITCTEAKDTYKLTYLDDNKLQLVGDGVSFTLSPKQ